ncbi:MAG: hypothetical protein ACLQJR_24935 [Stellaceae bacterium]
MTAPAPPARRRRAGLALALLLLASAMPLAACGKKAEPGPPPGTQTVFPRTYPHE